MHTGLPHEASSKEVRGQGLALGTVKGVLAGQNVTQQVISMFIHSIIPVQPFAKPHWFCPQRVLVYLIL